MAAEKFDWNSVGGRPANDEEMKKYRARNIKGRKKSFDWRSEGGRPASEEEIKKYHDRTKTTMNNDEGEPSSILEDIAGKTASAIPEIAYGLTQLPGEVYGAATHPMQSIKNAMIGPIEGASAIFNLPSNISKYAASKGYLPKVLSQLIPHIPVEHIEEKLGIQPKEPGEALVRMLSGFGPLGKAGKFSEASNLKRAGLGAAYAGGMEQNPITGALLSSIPGLVRGSQKAYGYLREPKRALNESKETLENIKHILSQHENMSESEKTGVKSFLNQVQEGLTQRHENLESRLPEIFPIKPKSETRSNLNQATNNAVTNLTEQFNNRYKQFSNQYGHNEIKEPFNWKDINLDNVPHVSITTKNMGHGVSDDFLNYVNSEGETQTIKFPADNASVDDYIDFTRELRDAAWDAKKSAKNATYGEAKSLRKTANRLLQLQGDAENKIRDTVGNDAFNHFKQIQQDYSQTMGPVKTEPAIFNAAYKKKISDKIHDVLLQPANEQIRDYLYQSPNFVDSLREYLMQGSRHPLRQGQPFNPASIDQDIQYLLTPEQRAAQAERLQHHHAQNQLNEVSKNIKNLETLTPYQEHQLRTFHPTLSEHISNESQRRQIMRQLEREKSVHEMNKHEHEQKLFNRKASLATIGTGLALANGHRIANLIKKLF